MLTRQGLTAPVLVWSRLICELEVEPEKRTRIYLAMLAFDNFFEAFYAVWLEPLLAVVNASKWRINGRFSSSVSPWNWSALIYSREFFCGVSGKIMYMPIS